VPVFVPSAAPFKKKYFVLVDATYERATWYQPGMAESVVLFVEKPPKPPTLNVALQVPEPVIPHDQSVPCTTKFPPFAEIYTQVSMKRFEVCRFVTTE
jgi:hypothetical protein